MLGEPSVSPSKVLSDVYKGDKKAFNKEKTENNLK